VRKDQKRRCRDSELWQAVEIAVKLTDNPVLQEDLRRAAEILKVITTPSSRCRPSAPPRSKEE
jgi:hypothetical protein